MVIIESPLFKARPVKVASLNIVPPEELDVNTPAFAIVTLPVMLNVPVIWAVSFVTVVVINVLTEATRYCSPERVVSVAEVVVPVPIADPRNVD